MGVAKASRRLLKIEKCLPLEDFEDAKTYIKFSKRIFQNNQ